MVLENTTKSFLDPGLVALMKDEVSSIKDKRLPVNRAFKAIAEKSGLKFNTVKNYYYRYIHEKDNRAKPSNSDGVYDRDNKDAIGSAFTDQEVRELMMAMLEGQAQGKSVRGCANEMAKNDKRLMLRYQNKYRNVLLGDPEYVESLMRDMSSRGMVYYNPFNKQVIQDQDRVSERELFHIIGGLVSNINRIDNPGLNEFLKGLQNLSEMAAKYKQQENEESGQIQERLDEAVKAAKTYRADVLSVIDRLMDVNKEFLSLPPEDKLTGLSRYVRQVENCIRDCRSRLAE